VQETGFDAIGFIEHEKVRIEQSLKGFE